LFTVGSIIGNSPLTQEEYNKTNIANIANCGTTQLNILLHISVQTTRD